MDPQRIPGTILLEICMQKNPDPPFFLRIPPGTLMDPQRVPSTAHVFLAPNDNVQEQRARTQKSPATIFCLDRVSFRSHALEAGAARPTFSRAPVSSRSRVITRGPGVLRLCARNRLPNFLSRPGVFQERRG